MRARIGQDGEKDQAAGDGDVTAAPIWDVQDGPSDDLVGRGWMGSVDCCCRP